MNSPGQAFEKLVSIVNTLMGENGCPWDRVQTRESLKPYLIEETYETLEALDENDPDHIKEELGDLLYQVLFHSKIAELKREFTIDDLVNSLIEKMVRRHPHVFGKDTLSTPSQVISQWDKIKKREKKYHSGSILETIPKQLPGLLRAQKLQKIAAKEGFDWDRIEDVLLKLDEEIFEFKEAVQSGKRANMESEFGDLLFVMVNIARHQNINAEESLRATNRKFIQRFKYIERRATESGKELQDIPLEEMETYWQEAKKSLENSP